MTFSGLLQSKLFYDSDKKVILLKCVFVNPISEQTFHFSANQSKKPKQTKNSTISRIISSKVVANSIY